MGVLYLFLKKNSDSNVGCSFEYYDMVVRDTYTWMIGWLLLSLGKNFNLISEHSATDLDYLYSRRLLSFMLLASEMSTDIHKKVIALHIDICFIQYSAQTNIHLSIYEKANYLSIGINLRYYKVSIVNVKSKNFNPLATVVDSMWPWTHGTNKNLGMIFYQI